MREVLYKKEFVKYETTFYKLETPIRDDGSFASLEQLFLPPTKKHPLFLYDKVMTDEETYSENFLNQMVRLHKDNLLLVIEKEGDKVAMKIFRTVTQRKMGVSWYKKFKSMLFITVNTKTGDFYEGGIENYQLRRKAKKHIRKNFCALDAISAFQNRVKEILSIYKKEVTDFEDIPLEMVSEFLNIIDPIQPFGDLTPGQRLFKFYLDKKGYKYPNNFHVFMSEFFGPDLKKCLKKCDKRMIDGFMMLYGWSGKKLKKALHNCSSFNYNMYVTAVEYFGHDWLHQDEKLLLDIFNSNVSAYRPPEVFRELISNEELKRVFSLYKQVVQYGNLNSSTLYDHVRMYCELKQMGEDIKWLSSSDDKGQFREEHLDWTDKLQFYRQGSYTRIYPEYTYELINKPFEVNGVMYQPVLLDDSNSYNNESLVQSNCVKGYVGKCSSIIVSLRRGEGDDMERATLEYQLTFKKELEIVRIERVQSLGRFNSVLESSWTDALLKLDEIMLYYVRHEKFDTVKIKKKCKNGVELESSSVWNDVGHLRWNKKTIEKYDTYYYNNEFFE
jgi:hypothetical protein